MYEIGVSIGIASNNVEEMRKIAQSGITNIEIAFGNGNALNEFDFQIAKRLADENGIKLWSFHLPFYPFSKIDPSSLDDEIIESTYNLFIELIKKGSKIGIDKYVVHPSIEPIEVSERSGKLKAAADFFSSLADQAYKYGATIAIEDLPRSCLGNSSEEISYLLSANDKLRVCFDTNHLLKENIVDFVRKHGEKIITLHISDYDFKDERHWLCGEGDIDWQELYNTLKEVKYNGVWLYEVGLYPSKTIDRRVLEYKDFYNNAFEIFEGKIPTPIGTRI